MGEVPSHVRIDQHFVLIDNLSDQKAKVQKGRHDLYRKDFFDGGKSPRRFHVGKKGDISLQLAQKEEAKLKQEKEKAANQTMATVPKPSFVGDGKKDEVRKCTLEKDRDNIHRNKLRKQQQHEVTLKCEDSEQIAACA